MWAQQILVVPGHVPNLGIRGQKEHYTLGAHAPRAATNLCPNWDEHAGFRGHARVFSEVHPEDLSLSLGIVDLATLDHPRRPWRVVAICRKMTPLDMVTGYFDCSRGSK